MGSDQTQVQEAPVLESDAGESDSGLGGAGLGDAIEDGVSFGADEPVESDMPLIDTVSGDVTAETDGYGVRTSGAVDDMPVLDTEGVENAVTEEAQAVTDGSSGEKSDTEGS